MIAKYRKAEYPGEWWLTDFTMEQVEKRLEQSEITIRILCDKISKLESTLAAAQERIKELEAEVRAYQRSGDFKLDDDTAENKRLRAEDERQYDIYFDALKAALELT